MSARGYVCLKISGQVQKSVLESFYFYKKNEHLRHSAKVNLGMEGCSFAGRNQGQGGKLEALGGHGQGGLRKGPSVGMFIEKNVLGRTQPSHLGDLGTGRLHSNALPDEFSHFHSIKFLVQK